MMSVNMECVEADTTPQQCESILMHVRALDGVQQASALSPNAKNPNSRRMQYAYVTDSADIEVLRKMIAGIPGVESAEIHVERRLL
jgi:hypothetical protein